MNKYTHILTPIILACIVNIIIYKNGWNMKSKKEYTKTLLPPGYIIAIVWNVILGLLGYLHYLLWSFNNKKSSLASFSIILFVLFCLSYPFLTELDPSKGFTLNLLTLIFAIILAIIVFNSTKNIKYLIYLMPLLLWSIYVNYVTNI